MHTTQLKTRHMTIHAGTTIDMYRQYSCTINRLKGSYDEISSFSFSLECYNLNVHRYDP